MDFLAHELTGLRRGRFSLGGVLSRSVQRLLLGHWRHLTLQFSLDVDNCMCFATHDIAACVQATAITQRGVT